MKKAIIWAYGSIFYVIGYCVGWCKSQLWLNC